MILLIQQSFERLVKAVIKRPFLVIGITVVVTGFLMVGMGRLYIDVSDESLFLPGDQTLKRYQEFQRQFGRDDAVLAAISTPEIFSQGFLGKLQAYQADLEASVPYLDKLTSLSNITSISDKNGELLIDELQELWPKNDANAVEFAAFRQSVISNPLFRNVIISEDGNMTLVIIRASAFATQTALPVLQEPGVADKIVAWHNSIFVDKPDVEVQVPQAASASGELDMSSLPSGIDAELGLAQASSENEQKSGLSTQQLEAFIATVREVSNRHNSDEFPILLAGGPIVDAAHLEAIHSDFISLLGLATLIVFIVLFYLLRRLSAVLIAMTTVILSVLVTMGLMGWMGSPMTPVTVALAPLLLTIGVADSVHFLSLFFAELSRTGKRDEAILYAVRRAGVAILFTSLTTAAGFLAFSFAEIRPIAEFGLLVAFGVMAALVYTLVLFPAVLSRMVFSSKKNTFSLRWERQVNGLFYLVKHSLQHSQKILLFVVAMVVVGIPGVMNLQFSHNVLEWFQEEHEVRVNTMAIDTALQGSMPLEVVIDTGREGGIYAPEFMQRLDDFARYCESLSSVGIQMGRTTSIVDRLKSIHSVLNKNDPDQPIPNNEQLIAQELLLFEGSGTADVKELIDNNFSMVRVSVRMSWADAVDYLPLRDRIEAKAVQIFGETAEVTVTGAVDLISKTLMGVMQSMSSSYLLAGSVIAIMLILLLRSLQLGLVSLVPNFLPIYLTLALMGYLSIPIDMFTVLLGGIALGLAVDDTVHFMHSYRHYRGEVGLSLEESLKQTVATVGPALLFTTIALSGGFFIFMTSEMIMFFNFGMLIGITIINALLADLLVMPALVKNLEALGWYAPTRKLTAV